MVHWKFKAFEYSLQYLLQKRKLVKSNSRSVSTVLDLRFTAIADLLAGFLTSVGSHQWQ